MAKVPVKNVRSAKISLYWEDDYSRGSNEFKTVQELADFLRDNPELARAVEYVPKPNEKKK